MTEKCQQITSEIPLETNSEMKPWSYAIVDRSNYSGKYLYEIIEQLRIEKDYI